MVPTGLFDLTPEQHEHVAWVKQVATETLAPIAARWPAWSRRPRADPRDGRPRAPAPALPRCHRSHGRDVTGGRRPRPLPAPRGSGHRQHRGRDGARAPGAGHLPAAAVRIRRRRTPLGPGRRARRGRCRLRADRARRRVRRGRPCARRQAGRRRVAPHRREGLDLQRPRGGLLLRLRTDHCRRWSEGRHRFRRSRRRRAASAASISTCFRRTRSADSSSTGCGSNAQISSESRTGVSWWRCAPSTCSGPVSARSRSGWRRRPSTRRSRTRTRASLRRAAPRAAVGRPHPRRDGDAGRDGPAHGLSRRSGVRRRASRHLDELRHGQAGRDRDRPVGRRRRPSRSTAHAPSSEAICSSTSIARSGRRASTRAPPRCSARSSPATSTDGPICCHDTALTAQPSRRRKRCSLPVLVRGRLSTTRSRAGTCTARSRPWRSPAAH